jgi:hypothetical protein
MNEYDQVEIKLLRFINAINEQAMRNNGRIFKILGNHDVWNLRIMTLIESDFSVNLHKKNHSFMPNMITCPPVRYDYLRQQKSDLKKFGKDRKLSNSVLWAGQPEFDCNLYTLNTLVPLLNKLSVTLLFKAHPGDMEYKKGGYANCLDKLMLPWVDVTGHKVDSNLFEQVDLVITQFSSVAIEAGFYGVPSLNVLFESAGKSLLFERTGSLTTSAIAHDACFVINEQLGVLDYLQMCLTDLDAREKVLWNFDQIYDTQRVQLPKLLHKIEAIIPIVKTK